MENVQTGAYILIVKLPKTSEISIGRLGRFNFKKGLYAYVGSAMNGLYPRVTRHFSKTKKKHWHIDYLLEYGAPIEAILIPSPVRIECEINAYLQRIIDSRPFLEGFGSSDCDCFSHLHKITGRMLMHIKEIARENNWLSYTWVRESEQVPRQ
ncbi:MAG: GIY-YIG nuclease family protein [Methanomassiliicoccales archaeon]|jgi:Uri superfamily endonuclease|nr:GIY-YIG nuclease family protein [Methanomassiliicoccales archaeon]